jgi:arylsulfatase A-like enzyme
MKRRDFLQKIGRSAVAGLAASSVAGFQTFCKSPAQETPNIVLITVDDLGWKDLGCMGSRFYETPNIDRLAEEGVVFTSAYAPAANCAPSRASYLTGQYTPRHGIYTVNSSERGESRTRKIIPIENKTVLDDKKSTIANELKKTGYVTAHVGKWHLGEDPKTQGFDVNVGGSVYGHPKSYFSPYQNEYLADGPEGEYLTDRLTDETLKFLSSVQKNPFFLHLSYYAVHTPIQAKKDSVAKYENKQTFSRQNNPKYAAMIETLDQNIGRVLYELEKLNLDQNTLVVITSDNGGMWRNTSMTPLRAGKGSYYEGGIRVPLIVRWLKNIRGGRRLDVPVSGIDFYPTFLGLVSKYHGKNDILDGVNLMPLLMEKGQWQKRPLFWHFPIYLENGNPETRDPVFRTRPGSVIRLGSWKLHEYFEDGGIELYNLKNDIGEKQNLSERRPDLVKELHGELMAWRNKVGAPVPSALNPDYDLDYDTKQRAEKRANT